MQLNIFKQKKTTNVEEPTTDESTQNATKKVPEKNSAQELIDQDIQRKLKLIEKAFR
jgi:hypothetical protein